MSRRLPRLGIVAVAGFSLSLIGSAAFAQSSATAPLSGVVVDKDGGVMPGVTVVVKNNATGVTSPAVVTNGAGLFNVAALEPGTYTVTVSLTGFKTAVLNEVKITTGIPADVGKVTLDIGQVSEKVEVTAHAEVVQTQATAITSTIDANQIRNLPLITKNALNFVTFLPGVDTGGTHSQRASTVAGLPQTALAISIDGVNTQDNYNKSTDGFFSTITPSVDAVEEVTVSTATPGADSSGQGAVQIKFVTRSGTNRYTGSLYEYYRDPKLNANSYFNIVNHLSKNNIKLNQYGGNVGGPIVLPGMDGHGRAFFFVNYEELRQPSEITRTRVVMNDSARQGDFKYASGGVTRTVNVMAVAAANGQITTFDPTISKVLGDIASAVRTTGTLTQNADPNSSQYVFNAPAYGTRHFPTERLDFNLTQKHRLSATYYFQKFNTDPDTLNNVEPRFPGFSNHGAQYSYRHQASGTVRSTLSPNIVNEAIFGLIWAPVYFFNDITLSQFDSQGGYALGLRPSPTTGFSAFNTLDIPTAGSSTNNPSTANGNNPESRNGWDWSLDERFNWQRGKHSLQFGGSFIQVKAWIKDQQPAQAINFGVDTTNDPAATMFTTANFPGASTTNLNDARYLYGLLTGRVTNIQGQLALDGNSNQYIYGGIANRRVHMNETGLFAQDAWRVKPNVTFNYGLRYELQLPIVPENSLYSTVTVADACGPSGTGNSFGTLCNTFAPGTLTGTKTAGYRQYTTGTKGYNTDWNNVAPSVGVAWLPNVRSGLLRDILGDPDQATLRAAYARAYNREGLGAMTTRYENNPGVFVQLNRNVTNGNLVLPGESWPLLLSETSRMGSGAFDPTPQYPLPISRSNALNLFDPDWQVGHVDSYSFGLQRSISRDMAFEVRYVGTRAKDQRTTDNWNEVNLVENGFLDEFKKAQANLYANIAAGRGQTIAYSGTGTGTTPLPIYLAYFNGLPASAAGTASNYTGTSWSNSTIVGRFAQLNPNPSTSASTDLLGSATFRSNAVVAGLPVNFFQVNPDVGNVSVDGSKGYTRYDSVQFNVRRRLSAGLSFDINYTYAKRWESRLDSLRVSRYLIQSTAGVPHAVKMTTTYDLPVGRGRRVGTDMNPWLDGVVGGWSFNLTGKVQSGQVLDFGNVRLVGMTLDDLQKSIQYRFDTTSVPGSVRVYNLPQDIIDNTTKAFSSNVLGYTTGTPTGRYLAPANGPDCIQVNRGDCAPKDLFVVAPVFSRFDFSAKKAIRTGGRTSFIIEVDVLNMFNAINFNPTSPGNNNSVGTFNFNNADTYRVTSSYSDVNGTFDPGSRVGQLILRFNF